MRKILLFLPILAFLIQAHGQPVNKGNFENGKVIKPLERFKYFEKQRLLPGEKFEPGARAAAIYQKKAYFYNKNNKPFIQAQKPEWECIGPYNVGGRVKSIAVHPDDDKIIYIGSASGGIWKTTDGGSNWEPLFDNENAISFGSLSIDRNNPEIIYAGTGEAVIGAGASIYLGAGIFKTTNGGQSWFVTGLTNVGSFSKVYVHPSNPGLVVAGAINRGQGFYKSTDAGKTWEQTLNGPVTDISINPDNDKEFLIGVNGQGVLYSSDGGESWEERIQGTDEFGLRRVSVQFAPSNPDIAYCLFDKPNNEGDADNEGIIYKSTNKGQYWARVYNGGATFFNAQGFYNNYIEVSPHDENLVFAGGIDVHKTSNGKTFANVTNGYTSFAKAHVDQHCAGFSYQNPNIAFIGNDGGIYKSTNKGDDWGKISSGLEITQFYALAIDQTKEKRVYGGTQDNGTLGNFRNPNSWNIVSGGDGFSVIVNKKNPNLILGEVYNGRMWERDLTSNRVSDMNSGIEDNDAGLWHSPIVEDPNNDGVYYHGRGNLYVSYSYGSYWDNLGQLGGQAAKISAIAVSRLTSEIVVAGNENGGLFISEDYGASFQDYSQNGLLSRYITDIETSYQDVNTIFVTYAGFGNQNIFRTTDLGRSWQNIGSGLPKTPINCVAPHPDNHEILFIGTDIGVFATYNGGMNWYPYGRGMPNNPVLDLQFRNNLMVYPDLMLRAATHGRSIWETAVFSNIDSYLDITSPAGGEVYISQTNQIISWLGFEKPVDILFSSDDGDTWQPVASDVQSNQISWNVLNRPTIHGRIKIVSKVNNEEAISNTFSIEQKEKGSVIQQGGVTFVPYGIAWNGENTLYTTSFYANSLFKINAETFLLEKKIPLPGDSLFTDLSYDKENHIIYLTQMKNTQGGGGRILVIDTTGAKLRELPTPGNTYPIGIELVDGYLVVGDRDYQIPGTRRLWKIDKNTGKKIEEKVNPYDKNYGPRGICYDGEEYIYQVCTYFPSSGEALTESLLQRISKNQLDVAESEIELFGRDGIINARGVDYDPRDKNIWLTDFGGNLYKLAGFDTKVSVENGGVYENEISSSISARIYPNPVRDFANASFMASKDGSLRIEIVNGLGAYVQTIYDNYVYSGDTGFVQIDAETLSAGIYYARFIFNGSSECIKKLAVIK